MAATLTESPDCDAVLNWLEAHSVSLRKGLPEHLLRMRWKRAGRDAAMLAAALQKLVREGWLQATPGLQPPHLRLTSEGFRRLIEATEPALETDDPVTVPAAIPEAIPEAIPVLVSVPAATPAKTMLLSEAFLRNDALAVFGELRLQAQNLLIGMTLSRYWQESGHRAGDLRTALDVLVRDGYLRARQVGAERYWQLTHDGAFFLDAPPTPARLLRLAPPLGKVCAADPPGELRRLAARILLRQKLHAGDSLDYDALRKQWMAQTPFDENALLHALDLLFKSGHVSIGSGEAAAIVLTAKGAGAQPGSGLFSKMVRALG